MQEVGQGRRAKGRGAWREPIGAQRWWKELRAQPCRRVARVRRCPRRAVREIEAASPAVISSATAAPTARHSVPRCTLHQNSIPLYSYLQSCPPRSVLYKCLSLPAVEIPDISSRSTQLCATRQRRARITPANAVLLIFPRPLSYLPLRSGYEM